MSMRFEGGCWDRVIDIYEEEYHDHGFVRMEVVVVVVAG